MSTYKVEITIGGLPEDGAEYSHQVERATDILEKEGYTIRHVGIGKEDE
jgi:hypothetical protein